jgi:hypothetical protein
MVESLGRVGGIAPGDCASLKGALCIKAILYTESKKLFDAFPKAIPHTIHKRITKHKVSLLTQQPAGAVEDRSQALLQFYQRHESPWCDLFARTL